MSLLDAFDDMKVDITPIIVTETESASGTSKKETAGTAIKGVVYNASAAKSYFSQQLAVDIDAVAVVDSTEGLDEADKVSVNSQEYTIDSIEDPGMNNLSGWDNVYTIGLKAVK